MNHWDRYCFTHSTGNTFIASPSVGTAVARPSRIASNVSGPSGASAGEEKVPRAVKLMGACWLLRAGVVVIAQGGPQDYQRASADRRGLLSFMARRGGWMMCGFPPGLLPSRGDDFADDFMGRPLMASDWLAPVCGKSCFPSDMNTMVLGGE